MGDTWFPHPDLIQTVSIQAEQGTRRYVYGGSCYLLYARVTGINGAAGLAVEFFTSENPDSEDADTHIGNLSQDSYRGHEDAPDVPFPNGIYFEVTGPTALQECLVEVAWVSRQDYCRAYAKPQSFLQKCWAAACGRDGDAWLENFDSGDPDDGAWDNDGTTIGSGGAGPGEFLDTVFKVLDDGDTTKELEFEVSAIDTATTRTVTWPNADVTVHKDNLVATTAPGVGDDTDDDYTVGSRWIDVTADVVYIAVDVTSGAAVWKDISTGGGGTEFADNVFRIQDDATPSKEIAFQASAITASNTRTITMADHDVDLSDSGLSTALKRAWPEPTEGTMQVGTSTTDSTMTPAIVKATYYTSQSGVPSSTPAAIGVFNGDTATGDIYVATGTTSSADWERIKVSKTEFLHMSAYIQNDGNALGKAALSVTLPWDCTVVSVKFRSDKGNFSSSTGSNYWTIDVLHVPAAGGVLSSATGLVVTPLQTNNAIFTGDIPNQLFDVGALDPGETSRLAGDMLTLSMIRTGSGVSQSSNGMSCVVEVTRT